MPTTEDTDFLHGVNDFSQFLGVSPRRAYYLLERRLIPARKLGNLWTGRKSRILAEQEAAENATLASGEEAA